MTVCSPKKKTPLRTAPPTSFRENTTGQKVLVIMVSIWFTAMVALPLLGIFRETLKTDARHIFAALTSPEALHAFFLTLVLTVTAVVINTVMGTLIAILLARRTFKGKLLLESIIDLPFAVSPVVAGLMFIILLGPGGWLGNWLEGMNIKIIYALPGMILATLFVTFPFVIRETLPLLKELGADQEEAAATLGATPWQTFRRVTLPSIKWGMAYGVTLTVARSIGEFGAVLVVSGCIIGKTQTATLFIHHQFNDYNYVGAFSAALVLALLSFVFLNVIQLIYRKKQEAPGSTVPTPGNA